MRIRTRSRSDAGFRRAGVRHTPDPQEWPEGTFTADQVETLLKDPDVIVEVLGKTSDEEPAPAGETAPAAEQTGGKPKPRK